METELSHPVAARTGRSPNYSRQRSRRSGTTLLANTEMSLFLDSRILFRLPAAALMTQPAVISDADIRQFACEKCSAVAKFAGGRGVRPSTH